MSKADKAAFSDLIRSTAQPMYRVAARILGNAADAEDVVQDAYVKAYDAWRTERFEGRSDVKTWLYRIVTNAAIDALRSRQRRGRWQVNVEAEVSGDGNAAEASAALREIAEWMEQLPPDQRAAVVLKEMEGLTNAEVAQVMGCSEGAVEQRLVRARATLRGRMGHD